MPQCDWKQLLQRVDTAVLWTAWHCIISVTAVANSGSARLIGTYRMGCTIQGNEWLILVSRQSDITPIPARRIRQNTAVTCDTIRLMDHWKQYSMLYAQPNMTSPPICKIQNEIKLEKVSCCIFWVSNITISSRNYVWPMCYRKHKNKC